jgi:hypothetical protein
MTTAPIRAEQTKPRMSIEGFYRVCPEDSSVRLETLGDPGLLMRQIGKNQGVCGSADASLSWFSSRRPRTTAPGTTRGTLALCGDDDPVVSIDRAIRVLEEARAGFVEAGHR